MNTKSSYACQQCGHVASKWLGKCPECSSWNSFVEELVPKGNSRKISKKNGDKDKSAVQISQISEENLTRVRSTIGEFDRVVGGGLVPGSVLLIGGEPGIGKSTLLMELSGKLATHDNVLYISGEESLGQVASRAKRLNVENSNLYIFHETVLQDVLAEAKKIKPKYIIIDSVQTSVSNEIDSPPGTVSQIREVTYELINYAKSTETTCFVIGHVTKEGSIAGPKMLEHMVDVVIYFEGDQYGHYRMLRVIKNRFGNVNEVGLFEMKEEGLREVKNPSQFFVDSSYDDSYGRAITTIVEGSRPLFVEIQALVIENKMGNGRRVTHGVDHNRLSMLVAVIEKYFSIPLTFTDIYVNVVGGIKLISRETDLAIMAAILSSLQKRPIREGTILLGEVGLTGEVRPIPLINIRLKEIQQMGHKMAVTSYKDSKEMSKHFDIKLVGLKSAQDLEYHVFSE